MSYLFLFLCAIWSPLSFTGERFQGCLNYEPDSVALTGTIKRKTFPGPPNYQSVAKGDEPEVVWVLYLKRPICVRGDNENEGERNVSTIQLVFTDPGQYQRYRSLLGQPVSVEGKLFHAQTGHHHTDVLMTVGNIKKR